MNIQYSNYNETLKKKTILNLIKIINNILY